MSNNICPNCNSPVTPGAAFCDNCGLNIVNAPPAAQAGFGAPMATQYQPNIPAPSGGAQCPNCGFVNAPGAAFCENCGMQVTGAPAPAMAPTMAGGAGCPQCGFVNVPGALFCEQCGSPQAVAAAPAAAAPVNVPLPQPVAAPPVAYPAPAAVGFMTGRLVVQSSNASLPLPQGRQEATLGREDPVSNIFPDVNLDPHGGHDAGVGRQHAKLVISGGQLCLVDLNSVNGSFVNRQKLNPNQPQPIQDGDEIRLGRLVLTYHAS